ncbi:hypothetical protein ACQEVI_24870 [Promicromonospora sp. CA-289599]|uniref:hypothetical protein n=1 Tax=Promicromonospora sp. CA-289599 TaxID=3240014 RepID=UPI003D8B77EC
MRTTALLFGGVGYLLWQAGASAIGTALAVVRVLHRAGADRRHAEHPGDGRDGALTGAV